MTDTMRQYAPFPHELADIVAHMRYRPGWTFELKDIERDPADTHGSSAGGLTFIGLTGTRASQGSGWSRDADWNLVRDPEGTLGYEGAQDAYRPGVARPVYFYFPVPAATFNRASWMRWVFDRILEVERHEAMEHFAVEWDVLTEDGLTPSPPHPSTHIVRPFAPCHGPGDDPYVIHEYADDEQRRTSFRGVVKETL